jgi:hypothetical protein
MINSLQLNWLTAANKAHTLALWGKDLAAPGGWIHKNE